MAINRKAAIEILFKEGIEQKEIAKLLKISETTVSKYVTENGMRKKRVEHSLRRNTAEENTLTALAHQSKVIRLISDKKAAMLPDNPADAELEDLQAALIPRGDIDALQKLFTTVKGRELEWSSIVKIIREFSEYLEENDHETAQEVLPHAHNYINIKREQF